MGLARRVGAARRLVDPRARRQVEPPARRPADLYRLFELMFTQLEWSDLGRCVRAMWDSIAMAWLGTLIAAVVAVPLGFLAAENLVPRWCSFLLRQLFNILRACPS